LTATRWVWRLANQYHSCHAYTLLIEQAAQRFEKANRSILARWATHKAIEERGHHLLALMDIESLGYDAEAVLNAFFSSAVKALINYLSRSVQDSDPIDSVGYSYTMERLAVGVDKNYIQKIEALLPNNVCAVRCLRVHSSIGADAEHVEETLEMITSLTPSERTRIARACYESALMYFSPPSDGYISNEQLQQILEPLRIADIPVGES
jgi:pyrroloquinoline quinone (PQQ) biosynthesis protein C